MTEQAAAAAYWAGREVGPFSRRRTWSAALAERIVALHPSSVFEFGCNVGRHLVEIHERDSRVRLRGVDINPRAVRVARKAGLPISVGDETSLYEFADDEFSVAYTSSVIDHIPDPTLALVELARIAPIIVLLEPYLGYEGKVDWVAQGVRANPFLYSWDYAQRLPGHDVVSEPFPIRPEGAGPFYRLHIATRR